MYCRNCGKEIGNEAKFCNYCGAAQNSGAAQNPGGTQGNPGARQGGAQGRSNGTPHPTYTAPKSPQKPKKKKTGQILLAAIVIVAGCIAGYYITGADKVKPPTAFDVPESFEFETLPSPSVKDNASGDGAQAETASSESATDALASAVKIAQKKAFVLDSDIGYFCATFFYKDSGIVQGVGGSIVVFDTSVVSADELANLKSDAELAQGILEEMQAGDSSYVEVMEGEEYQEYHEVFAFSGLDENKDMAELAAAFVGFETDNGVITIDAASEAMLGFGYTEVEQE